MVAYPAPATPRSVVLDLVADRFAKRTTRGVCVYMMTDSINDQGSDDGRFGSWHGGLQRLFEDNLGVSSVTTVINKMPLPDSTKPKQKWFGFETFAGDWSYGPPIPEDMEPGGSKGSGAGSWGLGRQASYQSANSYRDRTEYATGFHTIIRNNKITDTYDIYIDAETKPRISFTGGPVQWRKHMITGLDGGLHTITVKFTKGFLLIFNDIAVYRGTENRGIRVYNGGRSGVSLNAVSTVGPASDPNGSWAGPLPLLADDGVSGPDIVINSLGTNNMGDAADVFEKMLRSNTALIRKHAPNSIIFLMIPQLPFGLDESDWLGKIAAHHQIASEFANVIVTPLTTLVIPQGIPSMSTGTQKPLMIDVLHPKTPLYLGIGEDQQGKTLTYGYAPLSYSYMTGAIDAGTTPVVLNTGFSHVGDSLAEQFTVSNTKLKAGYPAKTFVSQAKGGYLDAEVAAYQGGEPAVVVFPNNSIPAGTGATTVTLNVNVLASPGATGDRTMVGTIAGVPGTLRSVKTTSGSTVTYVHTFARTTAGTATAVAATGAKFVIGNENTKRLMLISTLRNSFHVTPTSTAVARIKAMFAFNTRPTADHILFDIPASESELPGTTMRTKLDAMNAALKAAFPNNFVEASKYLQSEDVIRANGFTPTEEDIQNIADGITPKVFRSDVMHYNQAAYTAITDLIFTELTKRGFAPATTGTPTVDTTPPTVTIVSPADGFEVPDGGTVDFIVQASDASGIGSRGFFTPDGTVIGPGSPPALGNGQYGHLGVTAATVRALGATRWFATVKDASPAGNATTTLARTITVAAPGTPTDTTLPVITGVTPAAGTVFGTTVTISGTVTNATGIELAVVYREAPGKAPEYVGSLVKGAGDVWSGAFPSSAFLNFTGFTILAKAKNGKTAGTAANSYTFAAPADVTAPTGVVTSPGSGLTLAEDLSLRATVSDAESGVASVQFVSDGNVFVEKATLLSGTAASGVWGVDIALVDLLSSGGPQTGTREIHARFTDVAGNVSDSPSIQAGLPGVTDPGAEVFPSFDATTFMPTRPEVLAAWLAAFGAAGSGDGSGVTYSVDPDGTPVLVLDDVSSYLETDPDGVPVLVIGA